MEPVLLNNRYRLLELVGSGGMAVVYKGVDTLLQRRVAVKVLREGFAGDPAFLARFQREARAAANLDHTNVVTVYDVGQDDTWHYIVMEYVDNQDLKTLIRQEGRLGVDEALDITIQVCAGVGHAHKADVIHCDIKPQNVLVTRDGRAKVTDFGIARALSETGLTESETVWGSPLYFSPEQAAGESPSPASDVYSIGVMMYEMLAGSPPFRAEKPAALALMHMREEPPPLAVRNPQVPPQLEWIIRKVLAKEPSARYRTADQLAHVLEEYREHGEQMTGRQPATAGTLSTSSPTGYAVEAESPAVSRLALDRLTWILGIIAFVAVAGLIPLWWWVNQSWSASSSLPAFATSQPALTLTPTVQLIPVPPVVEKSVDEARRIVEQAGLRFVPLDERYEAGVEEGIVLEQSPAPDVLVPLESQVSVVVSGPGRALTMPGVVGYPIETVQDGLESDGLQVISDTVWSVQPVGKVIVQEPEPGTTIHTGDAVTLTVSGGVDVPIPLQVNLADQIVLESADLRQETFRSGGVIAVALHWQALNSIGTHYVVFVHLIDPDANPENSLVAQQDVEPIIPTARWVAGVEVVDPHQITIPADVPAGWYQLRAGMYAPGQSGSRLAVVDAGLTTAEADSILIAEIEIQP
ncbi:MAG: Stk1 family PASTA domain-containing Ser/Thr kinase [Chloroflexota bacterium]|nr:Stk1 family PASTA domain-containing Ser/Thr kinase [Chloroflexota bacterium]